MRRLTSALTAATLVLSALSALRLHAEEATAAAAAAAGAREPFRYAYISRNVNCERNGRMTRQVYVSQVFGYCEAEVSKGQIIRDTALEFRQVAKAACEGTYSVTFEFFNGPHRAEPDAEVERDRAMSDPNYKDHVSWFASVDYPSYRCQ